MNRILNRKWDHLIRSRVRCLHYTQEHLEIQSTVKKIVEKDINPFVDEWETKGMFDAHTVFKKLGNAGLLGITRDKQYGGLGLDYSFSMAFFEEFGRVCNSGGILGALGVQTDMALPALVRFGEDHLKKEFLTPSIAGDYVACVGVSEPEGGSDVAAIKTTAKRVGDDYVINGGKIWTTSGMQADWMCLLANTSDGAPHKNKSLICLPLNTPGVIRARKIEKIGNHSSDMAQFYFENVKVPCKYLIGEEGMGFMYQMMQFQDERLCAVAMALPGIERAVHETIEYCKQRITFGIPLIENQYIYFNLAELQSEIELLRTLVHTAADKFVEGEDVTYLASIAKLKCGKLSRQVADTCLQYFGAMGYTNEIMISRFFRDSRAMSIAGGADEIMLGIISKYMGILPKPKKK